MEQKSDWTRNCVGCKFADAKAYALWLKGTYKPYCTNEFRRMGINGECVSYRK